MTIPAGIDDGQVLRLKGKGGAGFGGGPPGDALIEVHIAPHPFFRRDGDNILHRAAGQPRRGGARRARDGADRDRAGDDDDPQGLGQPAPSCDCAARGSRRRAHEGDQYVTLKIVIGDAGDAELAKFLEEWAPKHPSDPRRGMGRRER